MSTDEGSTSPEEGDRGGAQPLARVVDPAAHDASSGARAVYRVVVPAPWLGEGGVLRIEVPQRLTCARCEGGGCEGCNNSGALRVGTERREVEITLAGGSSRATRVRLDEPFGAASPVRQLWIDLVPSADDVPAAALRFSPAEPELAEAREREAAPPGRSFPPLVWAALVALALVVILLATARR